MTDLNKIHDTQDSPVTILRKRVTQEGTSNPWATSSTDKYEYIVRPKNGIWMTADEISDWAKETFSQSGILSIWVDGVFLENEDARTWVVKIVSQVFHN